MIHQISKGSVNKFLFDVYWMTLRDDHYDETTDPVNRATDEIYRVDLILKNPMLKLQIQSIR